jgi:hypothetical protein
MMHISASTSALFLALVLFGTCQGSTIVLFANMTGSQVSGSASTATGTGLFYYDTVANVLNYYVVHNVQSVIGAHFHGPAPAGVEANIMFVLLNNNALYGNPNASIIGWGLVHSNSFNIVSRWRDPWAIIPKHCDY